MNASLNSNVTTGYQFVAIPLYQAVYIYIYIYGAVYCPVGKILNSLNVAPTQRNTLSMTLTSTDNNKDMRMWCTPSLSLL